MKKLSSLVLCGLLLACSDSEPPEATPTERATRVRAAQAQRRDIDYVLTALGSVESMQHPTISAETRGQIISVEVSEGDSVDMAQLLTSIDNTLHNIEVGRAKAELQRQSVLLENQRKEVARLKRLEKSQSVSKDQLEDQEAQLAMLQAQRDGAERQWERALHMESKTRVLAPHAGLIARRHISLGDYVTPGTPLFNLVSVQKLRARLAFPERNTSDISIGKEVHLLSPTAPGVMAIGQVTGINPQINVHNRAIEATVEFENPGGWLPGASVDATLIVEEKTGALTVPPTSIVTRNQEEVVFVIKNNRAESRAVKLGWREAEWVEVLGGLNPDDRVVVEGAALITDGSLLAEGN
ncbi:MAG: efflux RND transporter periplasmic adaptor subunit [Gammaproteobacteria bacterium]|nr:efflux RND transporter periplasmic adaptor subunit [Gammaproteobacteria bacterium]